MYVAAALSVLHDPSMHHVDVSAPISSEILGGMSKHR